MLPARLVRHQGEKLDKFSLPDETAARAAETAIAEADFTIEQVESKPTQRKPAAPFTTSTLQQEASRKLGFNAKRTMQVAQLLYQGVTIKWRRNRSDYLYADGRDTNGSRSD